MLCCFFEGCREDHEIRVFFECGVYPFFVAFEIVRNFCECVEDFWVFEVAFLGVGFCDVVAVDFSSVYYYW
ncbi:hypothetical protein C437_01730 [Haloarcula vallismortis ATCC 29715]|uniref:Uncharacterized protein n=1 Tax=Haloarcula vallismortis ATCC 29715 TaxID=662477 RepID=M0JR37_HALVA|nr:hypothetical protein C437_01730 [Haloarcula vallismortis ATCC 29715]